MGRNFSRIYLALEYGAVAISVELLTVGLFKGATVLAHMGAVVTVIGILLTFAIASERNRMVRVERILAARLVRDIEAAIEDLGAEVGRLAAATIRRRLRADIGEDMAALRERHEQGLLIAEGLLLTIGTMTWGFADLLHYGMPPGWPG